METRRPFTLNEIDYRLSKDEHLTGIVHERKAKTTNGQPSSSRHTTRDSHGNSQSIFSRTENEDTVISFLAANGFPITSVKVPRSGI
jgi:hypothetical protein